MPMEKIPEPREWTENWFTTWQSRKQNPNNLIYDANNNEEEEDDEETEDARSDQEDTYMDTESKLDSSTIASNSIFFSGEKIAMVGFDQMSSYVPNTNVKLNKKEKQIDIETFVKSEKSAWEDAPEVGTLCTVRLKIGEKVSRVTWDYASHLRRSRWRRKYFPRGSFPYDDIIVQEKEF